MTDKERNDLQKQLYQANLDKTERQILDLQFQLQFAEQSVDYFKKRLEELNGSIP